MTLRLSSEALSQVNTIVAQKNYAQAYQVVISDLEQTYGGISLNPVDQDVVQWLNVAIQVNSGTPSVIAVAIRANNQAAVQYEEGKTIALFGPENQASSNAVASSFFSRIGADGTLPDFKTIQALDAGSGLEALGLSKAAWAGRSRAN